MKRKRKSLSQEESSQKKNKIDNEDILSGTCSATSQREGRAGRVLRVYLKNFMCHSSLEVCLNPSVNYIIGRNGSGKSAILTALVVGLGGKAVMTNRGTNMKSFIKVGQNSALIEITLSNDGPMAYKPKQFGNKISVIRTFTDTGSGGYKIKSENGEVISTNYRDVRNLVEALNIQVDNPVCILNQDIARTFLNSADESKQYTMFMRATNLENVHLQYTAGNENKQATNATLCEKQKHLVKLEKERLKWSKRYSAVCSAEVIQDKKHKLNIEYVWSQVHEMEESINLKERNLEQLQTNIKNSEDFEKNKSDKENQLQEQIRQVEQQLMEIRKQEEEGQEYTNKAKDKLQGLRESMVSKEKIIDSVKQVIKRKNTDRQNIQKEIANAKKSQPSRQEILQKRQEEIAVLEAKLAEVTNMLRTTENDVSQTKQAVNKKKMELTQLRNEIRHLSEVKSKRTAVLNSLKSASNNSLSIYGVHMQKVLEAIVASKEQFSNLPRGPIGSYIRLKDKKWAIAIEDFIGAGMLHTFCVDNEQDSRTLNKIFNKILVGERKPGIICSKFINKVHDVTNYKTHVPSECEALIDAIKVTDPVIANCLIDHLAMECILLLPSSNLAIELMSQASRVPKNCTRCITIKGDQFYPDPSYRSYGCKQKMAKFLQVSTADVIKQEERKMQVILNDINLSRRQVDVFIEELKSLDDMLENIQEKATSLHIAKAGVQKQINDIKMLPPPPEINVHILQEELEEIDKYIEEKQNEIKNMKEETEVITSNIDKANYELDSFKKISKGLEDKVKPLINEMKELRNKLKDLHVSRKFQKEKLSGIKSKFEEALKDFQLKKNIFDDKKKKAEELGPEGASRRSVEEVSAELKEVELQIKDIKNTIGDLQSVTATYMQLQQKYISVHQIVVGCQNTLSQLTATLDYRSRQYHKLIEFIDSRVQEMFTGVLRIRQFFGNLEINHEKKTLKMHVVPRQLSQGSQHTLEIHKTNILSGGERSFSTVSFIHALWQVMEYPFYFLDEFDVFMDKVNRRSVMDILLQHATDHPHLQFVFLTPQDISQVELSERISVHRMSDPIRNKISISQT